MHRDGGGLAKEEITPAREGEDPPKYRGIATREFKKKIRNYLEPRFWPVHTLHRSFNWNQTCRQTLLLFHVECRTRGLQAESAVDLDDWDRVAGTEGAQ